MLKRDIIEKITVEAMKKFSRENNGSVGWDKEDFINAVLAEGGEENDVYQCMALGMDLCGIRGELIEQRFN
jgi:hypothetical protein